MVKKRKTVGVIGLGIVGLPTALYIKRMGFNVVGYDINQEQRIKAISKGIITSKILCKNDIYIICVSTGLKNNKPDMSNIFSVCKKISVVSENSMVSIESTVSLGTCRKIEEKYNLDVCHCPHRYWENDPLNYGVQQFRVWGGTSLEMYKFYSLDLRIPIYPTTLEVAEMSKISENAYRFTQIAFAEELKMICDKNNIEFEVLRIACNTKWNINILEARNGIGKECLPKDIRCLIDVSGNGDLLTGAVVADRKYKQWIK